MKILQVINDLNAGGAERLLSEIVPQMQKLFAVKTDLLLLSNKKNVFETQLKDFGIEIYTLPLNKPYSIYNILLIRKFIKKNNYDIIHAHLFPAIYWVSLSKKLIRKFSSKLVVTEHNTVNRRRKYKILRIIDKFIYKEFDAVVSVSERTQDELIKWLKIKFNKRNKFKVIENSVNLNRFKNATPLSKKDLIPAIDEEIKIICMVGNLMEQKDQPTLIKSMLELNPNVHLVLIGNGPRFAKLKNLIYQLGLNERVHLLGARSDVEKILKTIDIVVLSSNWEGFGLVAVEGMAAGKPVVASNVDGLREVVDGAGVLFEKGNVEQLVTILKKLLFDEEYLTKISKRCRERAEKYDISFLVEKTFHLYSSLAIN